MLLLPQRYVFSSKSQLLLYVVWIWISCCCYHKGTYFQANHNTNGNAASDGSVVVATTKVRIFKQITTDLGYQALIGCCCCYHKGTYFQANHNNLLIYNFLQVLLLLPQRYVFSSKSQQGKEVKFHNSVVVATTKVRIFKQITTTFALSKTKNKLLLLPQRYVFSSKSQHIGISSSSS